MKKKITAILMAIAMLFVQAQILTIPVHAESAISGTCGEALTWEYDEATKTLTISGTGEMDDNPDGFPQHTYEIQKIVIMDGVTAIGDNAFDYFYELLEVEIPESVTYIGNNAFKSCSALEKIDLPNQLLYLGDYAMSNCRALKEIIIPSTLQEIGEAPFSGCVNLVSITVEQGNPKYISPDNCNGIIEKDTNTLMVGCKNTIIPEIVEHIGDYAFSKIDSLANIELPKKLKTIGQQAFEFCYSLHEVVVPSTTTKVGFGAFYFCTNLERVVFKGDNISIENNAFDICYMDSIYFEGNAPILSDNAFAYIETTIYYPTNNDTWTSDILQNYGGAITWVPYEVENDDEPIENPFTDVPANEYYYDPVLWALENNITSGLTATTFAPEASCTRGQVVTFLWRAHGCPEPKSTTHNFTDLKANEYYYKAVLWAVENGITSGLKPTLFAPDATVTRGQFVTFLHRAEGKPAYTVSNPFTDLKTGEYYYDAVLWAVENKVTSGLKPTLFGPDEPCTRGQVVTFLYRAYNE